MRNFKLFEYQNREKYTEDISSLDNYLDEIWKNRETYQKLDESLIDKQEQRFLKINHKNQTISANNYVGVIFHEEKKIEIYPKIFYNNSNTLSSEYFQNIQNHILWYLSYSNKIHFPSYLTNLGERKFDLLEIIIYMFSSYTKKLLSNSIFRRYEIEEDNISICRGRINIKDTILQNFSRGKYYKLNCSFDEFSVNNKFNQIIKFVSRLLYNTSEKEESKKLLREILFILDEVDDVIITINDCNNIVFPIYFKDHEVTLNFCKLILSNSVTYNYKNKLRMLAYLLPMEIIYQEFISGFLKKEFASWSIKSQDESHYLDNEDIYKIKPDIIVKNGNGIFLADSKYKVISIKEDKINGILSSDLYQMVSYAIRKNITKVKILYPETIQENLQREVKINVNDMLANGTTIEIEAHQIPMIDRTMLEQGFKNTNIKYNFSDLKENLKAKFSEIFM